MSYYSYSYFIDINRVYLCYIYYLMQWYRSAYLCVFQQYQRTETIHRPPRQVKNNSKFVFVLFVVFVFFFNVSTHSYSTTYRHQLKKNISSLFWHALTPKIGIGSIYSRISNPSEEEL